ncbi:MAG: T9SS type A sorting domain-containing protein [Muribaculum sp.]|nr:T9SS type A sorting domain-containing protein [Muribaculum sp.]
MKTIKLLGIALAIIMTVFGNVNLCASENYKSMIRHDRVWESVCFEWGPHTVKYMKFDGKEEINGKVYDRIVTFRKTIFNRNSDYNGGYEYIENINENEGYLREEDGKVYTLVLGIKDKNHFCGDLYLSSDTPCPDDYELSEQLVYDFTLDEGSFYNAFSNGGPADFKVKSRSQIKIGGEDYIKIGVSPCFNDYVENVVYEIVEGIGSIDHGCLNYNEFIAQPTRPWAYNYFNRLFDDSGNILFESLDSMDYQLPTGAFSAVATLNESPSIFLSNGNISFGEDNHLNAIKIYDMNGRLVKSVSGAGRATLSTRDLTSGIYISVAETDGKPISRRKFSVK